MLVRFLLFFGLIGTVSLIGSWASGVPLALGWKWSVVSGAVSSLPVLAYPWRSREPTAFEPRWKRSVRRGTYPGLVGLVVLVLAIWHVVAGLPWARCRSARWQVHSEPMSYQASVTKVDGYKNVAVGETCRIDIALVHDSRWAIEEHEAEPTLGPPPREVPFLSCTPTCTIEIKCPRRKFAFGGHGFPCYRDELGFRVSGKHEDNTPAPPTVSFGTSEARVFAWMLQTHFRSEIVMRVEQPVP